MGNYSKRIKITLLSSLCFLFLTLCVGSLFLPHREALTYDERFYYESGLAILSGKPSEVGKQGVAARNIMPALALNASVGEAIPEKILSKLAEGGESSEDSIFYEDSILHNNNREARIYVGKLATIFVSLIAAIYVFIWSRELYGLHAGFLSLILYILDPNIIAHSRLVHQDILGACSVFVATYYFWRVLKYGGRKNTILSIITFGIAQITRYTAIFLVPIYLLLTLGFHSSTIINLIRGRDWKNITTKIVNFGKFTMACLLATILIINIGLSFDKTFTKLGDYDFASKAFISLQSQPLLKELPVPLPYAYLSGLDFGKSKQETGFGSGPSYLMGRLGLKNGERSPDPYDFKGFKGFKEYYLIAFLYKVPIATQLLIILAIWCLIRDRKEIKFWQNEAFLLLPFFFYFCTLSLTASQLGIRYILMIFPFLFVVASRVTVFGEEAKARTRVLVVSMVAYLLISNLSYFPHYVSYFNEFLLDRKMGYTILADSNLDWGQDVVYVVNYLQKNPEIKYVRDFNPMTRKLLENEIKTDQIFNIQQPQVGLVTLGANMLVGIAEDPKLAQFTKFLRDNLKPVGRIAYSYLVFDIRAQDLAKFAESSTQTISVESSDKT
nr:ORF2 [Hormoscilla sp. GUM007]